MVQVGSDSGPKSILGNAPVNRIFPPVIGGGTGGVGADGGGVEGGVEGGAGVEGGGDGGGVEGGRGVAGGTGGDAGGAGGAKAVPIGITSAAFASSSTNASYTEGRVVASIEHTQPL
eukprot:CAMPEP_0174738684 /NCGR_PEP_ID=MMETSP1094-20130205/70352_1 /TAXON_ID=156173 /ORGANISM="Chrysochromulina brevifilum, Strain UTEX LB 985" /LENGTH=116 /DNA_ID=CAMNT_0015942147 /DNA_START=997 /DNA_END=1347 /DNA_ORIENTATION=+